MGQFYVNHTVCQTDVLAVVKQLSGREVFVSPAINGCVVVFDELSDSQDESVIEDLAVKLSVDGKSAFAILNHDDDILVYWLAKDRRIIDRYNSAPDYFEATKTPRGPAGGDADVLCAVFNCTNVDELAKVLHPPGEVNTDGTRNFDYWAYVFAYERHQALATAVGLPSVSVGFGFKHLAAGEMPQGFEPSDFVRVKR